MRLHMNAPGARTPLKTPPRTSVNHNPQNIDSNARFQANPPDLLLADLAIRIQLSRTDYARAVRRYESVSQWIERDRSLLSGLVELFYAQGSMAIGATIAARGTDEFDIDVVVQLLLAGNVPPETPLDMLYEAIRGEPGSRYYRMTRRRTRCVTVEYEDGMHIDFTPAVRRRGTPDRESWIFHDRPEAPGEPSMRLVANPYGFAEWYIECTPPGGPFIDFYMQRAEEHERTLLIAEADAEPVPPQQPALKKSNATIALQLLKRWRNVQYESRSGRRPPSIMIAKLVADAANRTDWLGEELLIQAEYLLGKFQAAQNRNSLISIVNPVCDRDVLTDRWPETLAEQATFVKDLTDLVSKLKNLFSGCDLGKMKKIMAALFGEDPTERVFSDFTDRIGSTVLDGSRHIRRTGGLAVPLKPANGTGAAAAVAVTSARTPKHTFYGNEERHL